MYFEISNPSALVSEVPEVRVTNLEPGSRVTLRAEATDKTNERWTSSAVFAVPESGILELNRDAPESGSYAGVDANGLIWSLRPRDDLETAFFQTPEAGFTVTLTLESDGAILETAMLFRSARNADIKRLEVREDGLVGTFFTPATGAHIGVLELGGSEGKLYETRAALLASQGLAVLALAYFDLPGLPDQLINIPLEYFERGLKWLQARPEVSGERIGVLGSSKGGEAALLIGATYPQLVGGVIGVVPSGFVYEGIDRTNSHPAGTPMSSWSLEGNAVPYVPYTVNWDEYFSQPPPVRLTPAHIEAVTCCDPATLEAARIHVERIETPVLLVSGGDDATWQSGELSNLAQRTLEMHGRDVEHITDAEAGHYLSLPGFPTFVRTPWGDGGGTPAGNARVQSAGWTGTLEVLQRGANLEKN
jgi:dienelactone hydrolase